jgi:hypothetical protein
MTSKYLKGPTRLEEAPACGEDNLRAKHLTRSEHKMRKICQIFYFKKLIAQQASININFTTWVADTWPFALLYLALGYWSKALSC